MPWEHSLCSGERLKFARRSHPGHPGLIAADVRLGEALIDEGHPELAEPLLREAVTPAHDMPLRPMPE
jgi:hypothetical protein